IRGDHANLNSEFIFIALNGSCEILIDDGQTKQKIILNDKTKGLYIDKMIWKQMYNFSKDCILLVLTNTYYDEKEYIYDYKYFCELKNNIGRRGGVCYKNHALKVA
ncbi:WxcM-like domain-containing protein, partial [Campylobacter jejuni]|nr:WxcM-like domain-containing protein [Campylobacter jejuni]EDO8333090.1 WxcM-like domain-containing protein [Campylobacter jejuni]EHV9462039.1 FdtA/QdtA family cupin domain-containing protein [Campylobacter jejuni]